MSEHEQMKLLKIKLESLRRKGRYCSVHVYKEGLGLKEIGKNIFLACHFKERFFGLMGRKVLEPMDGFLLFPCRSIHTCFMRFAIDVVCADAELRVVNLHREMGLWKTFVPRGVATVILELPAGEIDRKGLAVGDVLVVTDGVEV